MMLPPEKRHLLSMAVIIIVFAAGIAIGLYYINQPAAPSGDSFKSPSSNINTTYRGSILVTLIPTQNFTAVIVNMEFNPPTTAGITATVEDPTGHVERRIFADAGVTITTLAPSVNIDKPGKWNIQVFSGQAESNIVSVTLRGD